MTVSLAFLAPDIVKGVPVGGWRPALEQHLGKQVNGIVMPGGTIDWSFGRKRGLSL
jgi:Protein of unknown function (DUF3363)